MSKLIMILLFGRISHCGPRIFGNDGIVSSTSLTVVVCVQVHTPLAETMIDWFFLQVSDPEPKNPDRAQIRQEEINTNAFMAHITSRRVEDLKLYAIWALRSALEDEPWNWSPPHFTEEFDDDIIARLLYKRTIYTLDGFTIPAAQWIIHAGHLIFNCEEEYDESGSSDPAKGGDLWNGKHGFCRERWGFWKERFGWIQTRDELEDDTRAVAKIAVDAMEKVEKDPQTEIWKEKLKQ